MPRTSLGTQLVPALLVRDIRATLEFYAHLGFVCTGVFPDEAQATWAEVQREGITLQFHTNPPQGTPATPICSGTFYLFPESVRALAEEWRGRVEFAWGPEVMNYGQREFAVQDPNGYYLAFAEPA